VVFDKTGTITEGEPVVTDFIAVERVDEVAAPDLAGAEAGSEHFLGAGDLCLVPCPRCRAGRLQRFRGDPRDAACAPSARGCRY
jgi:magnesium-transporting ATPase (P-type)